MLRVGVGLLVALALLSALQPAAAGAKKGVSEEGPEDCDKATGWEALEMPEADEGCVWDIFTAIGEWFEELPGKLQNIYEMVVPPPLPPPPPPPPPGMNEHGCMIGWMGKDCDECAPGYTGDACDEKEL